MERLKELEAKKHIDAYIPDTKYQGKQRGKEKGGQFCSIYKCRSC